MTEKEYIDEIRTRTRFSIISAPKYIEFNCPYCKQDIRIDFADVDAPECWSDSWGEIECPECKNDVYLGEWDYD